MDRDDDVTREPATEGSEGDFSRGDRPAGPSQPGEGGFAEGNEQAPDTEREPDYARGRHGSDDDTEEAEGRFSRGAEAPGTEESSGEGTFATGTDQVPDD
jgi:hypothetical protein